MTGYMIELPASEGSVMNLYSAISCLGEAPDGDVWLEAAVRKALDPTMPQQIGKQMGTCELEVNLIVNALIGLQDAIAKRLQAINLAGVNSVELYKTDGYTLVILCGTINLDGNMKE